MKKIFCYNLNVHINESLPLLPAMHDYTVGEMIIENDKLKFITEDFIGHDYDYYDIAYFKPKKLSIEFCDLCDTTFFVGVSRFYPKKQFREKHKNNFGRRVNIYQLKDFVKFYKEYDLQFNYFSVSYNEVIIFFNCNNTKKAHEAAMQIQRKKVIYTFTD